MPQQAEGFGAFSKLPRLNVGSDEQIENGGVGVSGTGRRRKEGIDELGARNAAFSDHSEEEGLGFWEVPGTNEVVDCGTRVSGVAVTLMKKDR